MQTTIRVSLAVLLLQCLNLCGCSYIPKIGTKSIGERTKRYGYPRKVIFSLVKETALDLGLNIHTLAGDDSFLYVNFWPTAQTRGEMFGIYFSGLGDTKVRIDGSPIDITNETSPIIIRRTIAKFFDRLDQKVAGLASRREATPSSRGERFVSDCRLTELPDRRGQEMESVAVIDFQSASSLADDTSRGLADLCRAAIQESGRYILVDRHLMLEILGEEDFAAVVDCDDTRCLVDFGKKLRAQKMVHGRVSRVGGTLVLTLRMTDVGSAKIDAFKTVKVCGDVGLAADSISPLTCELLREALGG